MPPRAEQPPPKTTSDVAKMRHALDERTSTPSMILLLPDSGRGFSMTSLIPSEVLDSCDAYDRKWVETSVYKTFGQIATELRAKGARLRWLPFEIHPEAHRISQKETKFGLGAKYREEDLVVCQIDSRPWPPDSFGPRFIAAAKAIGFPGLHFHALRHTAISISLELGTPVKAVQEMAGHHSAAFTLDRYGHVTTTIQREAAARMDEVLRRNAG